MKDLKEYQRQGVRAAAEKPAYGWVMDRGTGKTPVCLKNAEELIQKGLVKRALYVAPLSTMDAVKTACFTFCSSLRPTLLWGSRKDRVDRIERPRGNIDIINFEACRTVSDALFAAGYDLVIIDESIRIADMDAQVSKVLKAVGRRARYRRIATGSPFTEGLEQAWNQFDFLDPQIFGRSGFYGFRNRYCVVDKKEVPERDPKTGRLVFIEDGRLACNLCRQPSATKEPCSFCGGTVVPKKTPKMRTYSTISGYQNIEEFEAKIAPLVFRAAKKDVLPELPDKTFETLSIELVDEQRKLYRKIEEATFSELSDGTIIDHATALGKLQKLREVASGFVYGEDKQPSFVPSAKYEELTKMLAGNLYGDQKVVIFGSFRTEPDMIASALERSNKKIGVYRLPAKREERQPTIDRWSAHKGPAVFIGNIASTGVGLNLQVADWAIFFSLVWSLDLYNQAIDRIHRIGSEVHPKILITHMVTEDTIEVQILKALQEKRDLVEVVLDHLRDRQKGHEHERFRETE